MKLNHHFLYLLTILYGCQGMGEDPYFPVLFPDSTEAAQWLESIQEIENKPVIAPWNALVEINDFGNMSYRSWEDAFYNLNQWDSRRTDFVKETSQLFFGQIGSSNAVVLLIPREFSWKKIIEESPGAQVPYGRGSNHQVLSLWGYILFFLATSILLFLFFRHVFWVLGFSLLGFLLMGFGGLGSIPLTIGYFSASLLFLNLIRGHWRKTPNKPFWSAQSPKDLFFPFTFLILGTWGWFMDLGPKGPWPGFFMIILALIGVLTYFYIEKIKSGRREHPLFVPLALVKRENLLGQFWYIIPLIILVSGIPFWLMVGEGEGILVPLPAEEVQESDSDSPWIDYYFSHRAYQELFMDGIEYQFPLEKKPVIVDRLVLGEEGYQIQERTLLTPDQAWGDEVLEKSPPRSLGLFISKYYPRGVRHLWISAPSAPPGVGVILSLLFGLMGLFYLWKKKSKTGGVSLLLL